MFKTKTKQQTIKIIFFLALTIFLLPSIVPVQAAVQGCCEKTLKTTLKFEATDMDKEPCEELKKDTEKYENVIYYENKVAFLGRCRSEADISKDSSLPKFSLPEIKVSIPGLVRFTQPDFCPDSNNTKICFNWIGQYIGTLFNYLIMIIGVIAAIVLMVGGVRWLTSAGSNDAIKQARSLIINSLLGLALTFCSYILLVVINPALVSFSPLQVTWIEGLGLLKNKSAGGACNNGECTQIDDAVTNNSSGISGAIIKSMLVGGEGCSPKQSYDGLGSCGYCQALPKYRISICGLEGNLSDCELFKKDIQADINCAAKFLMEQAPRCGNFEDIVRTASCYNGGGTGQNCGTNDYCHRVGDYFNNKCGSNSGANQTTPPKKP